MNIQEAGVHTQVFYIFILLDSDSYIYVYKMNVFFCKDFYESSYILFMFQYEDEKNVKNWRFFFTKWSCHFFVNVFNKNLSNLIYHDEPITKSFRQFFGILFI
jgi:hypothetical protein